MTSNPTDLLVAVAEIPGHGGSDAPVTATFAPPFTGPVNASLPDAASDIVSISGTYTASATFSPLSGYLPMSIVLAFPIATTPPVVASTTSPANALSTSVSGYNAVSSYYYVAEAPGSYSVGWELSSGSPPAPVSEPWVAHLVASFVAPPPLPTTTTLVAGNNPIFAGMPETLTVNVVGSNSPTGDITFTDTYDGEIIYTDTAALVSGSAVFSPPPLVFGGHTFTASYSGDLSNDPSFDIIGVAATEKAMTNQPFPNRIWLQCDPSIGPFASAVAGAFDATTDLAVWVDGDPVSVVSAQFDANNNRYLLYTQNPFNTQGVVQVLYHVPNPPFFDANSPPAPVPGLAAVAAYTTMGDTFLPPSASLLATPAAIPLGAGTTLSWTVFNVAQVSITSSAGSPPYSTGVFPTGPTGGSIAVPPGTIEETATFTLHTYDVNGHALSPAPTATVTVT